MKKEIKRVNKYTDFELADLFNKKEEIEIARKIIGKYLADYEIEGLSDRNLLRQLVYLEVVTSRLQNNINKFEDENNATPYQLIDTLHKNLSKIVELREKLGLNKKKDSKEDDYTILKKLQKKFRIWMDNNIASRTAICPHCLQFILFKIRIDGYLAEKHPFYKDRWIFNEELWKMYKEGILSKLRFAKVLQVSEDYIEHIENKVVITKQEEPKIEEVKIEAKVE